MRILRTADETHRRHAVATRIHAVLSGLDKLLVIRQTEVVVGAEVYHFLAASHCYSGRLRRDNHALILI